MCLFKDFPHQQLILFNPTSNIHSTNFTCTLAWLVQYSDEFENHFDNRTVKRFPKRSAFEAYFKKCNLDEKFKICLKKKSQKPKRTKSRVFWDTINIRYNVKWLQYVIEVYFQTSLCVISIVTNTLSLLVLRNKSTPELKKNLNNHMHKHMQVNSAFNLVYSAIKLVSLVNICIFPRTSFCSQVFRDVASQYSKIYIVEFAGNAFRLCANLSYIAFSVSRYFLSTSVEPSKFFKKFKNMNLKAFYAIIFVISVCLSLIKVFQFQVRDKYDLSADTNPNYPLFKYDIEYCEFHTSNMLNKHFLHKCQIFKILNMINNVLNNVVFFFISIFIDVGLIQFTNENLAHKRRLFDNVESHAVKKAIKLKEKVNMMIITNGLLYFVSHVPEFIMFLFMTIYGQDLLFYCTQFVSCVDLVEISQPFNFLSIGLQFFVFLRFDKNFSHSLRNLWQRFIY